MDRDSLLKPVRYAFYLVLAGALLYGFIPIDPLSFQPLDVKLVVQRLITLIIVALFLERALEVYKLFYLAPERERLMVQMEQYQVKLKALISASEDSRSQEIIQTTKQDLLKAQESLQKYTDRIRQSILLVAIMFGFLISSVGIRALEGLLEFPEPETTLEVFRLYLFRVLDLMLTAGLIAGGSEGIHSIIKQLYGFFPETPDKIIAFLRKISQETT
ncbi:MAG: hypothetical protein ACFB2W_25260 [Leptolyngbyaceae cyanobacterium]